MKEDPFSEKLESTLDHLRSDPESGDLRDFERKVWAEIALHDERPIARIRRWFSDGVPVLTKPAAIGIPALTILLGAAAAVAQSSKYKEQATLSMEQRYVSSIHAVLRSETYQEESPKS
ncbi:MAG: hypothetical protein MI807_12175 [Verrucomicrobiales bacterium]|nr:hypothetical protein [Verrucomicrobiales bacterium]